MGEYGMTMAQAEILYANYALKLLYNMKQSQT